ncbi:MAG: bifunctional oligoribonuclease/PAP phosphatase NrnA [Oscillospiraceae bacterium]
MPNTRIDTTLCARRLLEADDILLLCHRDPDGDSYGSAMALFDGLTGLGKLVRVECVSPFPPNLDYLNREMPAFSPRFVAAIDCAAPSMLGDGADRNRHIDLCIDHHPTNPLFADETLLVDYAATGEAMLEVLRAMQARITPACATALFTALSADTGGFRYSNTSTQTLRYAADLIEAGADFNRIRVRLFESKSRGMILVESTALANVHYYAEGRIAVIAAPLSLMRQSCADESELEGLAAKPLQIEGVQIGITLKEREDGYIRVSVRTSETVDAAAICQQFAGGGHIRASGCRIRGSVADAEEKLVSVALEALS